MYICVSQITYSVTHLYSHYKLMAFLKLRVHNVPGILLLLQMKNNCNEFIMKFSSLLSACREEGADQEVIDLLPGNQYILPYRPISSLVHSGAAKLIWPHNSPVHTPRTIAPLQDITPGQPTRVLLGVYRLRTYCLHSHLILTPNLRSLKANNLLGLPCVLWFNWFLFFCVPLHFPLCLSLSLSLISVTH